MKNFIDSYMVMIVFCSIGLMMIFMSWHSYTTNPVISQIGADAQVVCLKDRCVFEQSKCPLCQESVESWGIITDSDKFIGERYFADYFKSWGSYTDSLIKLEALDKLFWSGVIATLIGLLFGAYILNMQIRRE